MNKTLLKSNNASIKQANKKKYIKGGAAKYNFEINKTTNSNNIIKIIAINNADSEKKSYITYFTKSTEGRNLKDNDIEDIKDKTLNIITANLTETNYYATIGNIIDYKKFIYNINLFDTCVIVKLSNDNIYVFLKVEKKNSNIALKSFDTYQTNENNISQIDATMIKKLKSLGLDINFVNKFVAGVKGYIDGQKGKIKQIIEDVEETRAEETRAEETRKALQEVKKAVEADEKEEDALRNVQPIFTGIMDGGKKINTNKILNNLILKLSKINNVKKPTKPKVTKATKPNATKSTKPKPKAPKPTKPTKPKPKVTKPKATKKI